jgi:hypothetical protein
LFGFNAVDPNLLDSNTLTNLNNLLTNQGTIPTDWNFNSGSVPSQCIDLDSVYSKIAPQGWIAVIRPYNDDLTSPYFAVGLFQVVTVSTLTRVQFGVSAKISRVLVDVEGDLAKFYSSTRNTSALIQSEPLAVPEQPLNYPLYGNVIALETQRNDLSAVQFIAITGKRQKIAVGDSVNLQQIATTINQLAATGQITFYPYTENINATGRPVNPGDVFTLMAPPTVQTTDWPPLSSQQPQTSLTQVKLQVQDAHGNTGTITTYLAFFRLVASGDSDPVVSEYAQVVGVDTTSDPAHTQISLQNSLANCYERAVTTVNANVGAATHGQSVAEIMGGGDATQPNQVFTLKQSPLTYVPAPNATGRQSTLQIKANGAAWTEVPSLYEKQPTQTVFSTLGQADNSTDALFGDGVEGAALPTGQNNIQALYRIGSGSAGNVGAASLTTLVDRPLGVSGVTNPQPATGGTDPQSMIDLRANAPMTVLTLGRAVSMTDYQNFAAIYPGIAKAYAVWIPSGPMRGIFITVAGIGGAPLVPPNTTLTNLVNSLQNSGNPLIPIQVQTFIETLVGVTADVKYADGVDPNAVGTQVINALQQTFGFAQRNFGQGMSVDQVAAVIQAVPGVVAVNVRSITPGLSSTGGDLARQIQTSGLSAFNVWTQNIVDVSPYRMDSGSPARICPYLPVPSPGMQGLPLPAELLVLDPNPANVVLNVML